MYEILLATYLFGVGAIIGSFLNVLIWRLPRGEGFVLQRSHCPHCDTLIRWYDNIPLLSFIILRGHCRKCAGSISVQYPAVELTTGLIFCFSYLAYGLSAQMIGIDIFLALLLVVIVTDFRHYLIPDKITLPGMVLGLLYSLYNPLVSPLEAAIGLVGGGLVLLLLAWFGEFIFKKEALGGGDIKLAAMLGAWLGWQNLALIFLLGAMLGLFYAIIRIVIAGNREETRLIPFGPFLALAAIIALFWGQALIDIYVEQVLYAHF
jgi:leader peptidase (prepilin peptidase)/N-methyltransferase